MTNQTNKSFVLHTESLESVLELSDQQAGKIFKLIINYQKSGQLGKLDQISKLIITPIINQFKRDKEKYHNSIIQGKIGNLKKYHKKIYQRVINGEISLEQGEKLAYPEKSIISTYSPPPITPDQSGSHNVYDNVNVSDNIYVNDKENNNNLFSEIDELTKGLKFVLEEKLKKKLNTNSWKKEIELLVKKDLATRENPVEDVKKVIQEISNRFGEQYFPEIESASSLRKKFSKVEAAIYRNQKQPTGRENFDYQKIIEEFNDE